MDYDAGGEREGVDDFSGTDVDVDFPSESRSCCISNS